MQYKVTPNLTINRAGYSVTADKEGNIETDIPEIVSVLNFLTGKTEEKQKGKKKEE